MAEAETEAVRDALWDGLDAEAIRWRSDALGELCWRKSRRIKRRNARIALCL
jgi:hypothetical protein